MIFRTHTSPLLVCLICLLIHACSSAPKVSDQSVGQGDADRWFAKYCAPTAPVQVTGDLIIKSTTPEFKGQFPASVQFLGDGKFQLEVTNLIGGTVAQLKGDERAIEISVPSKPKFNRSGLKQYLGLEISVLLPLLRGELPCPPEARSGKALVVAEGNAMKVRSTHWDWYFYRSPIEQGEIPAKVVLKSGSSVIEMNVDDWIESDRYLKKGHLRTPEGEMKWTWRNRTRAEGVKP